MYRRSGQVKAKGFFGIPDNEPLTDRIAFWQGYLVSNERELEKAEAAGDARVVKDCRKEIKTAQAKLGGLMLEEMTAKGLTI